MIVQYQGYTEPYQRPKFVHDYAVPAVSAALNMNYNTAYQRMSYFRRQMDDATTEELVDLTMDSFGYDIVYFPRGQCRTIKSAVAHLDPSLIHLVWIRRHLLCIRGGKVWYWTNNRQHHVRRIGVVVPKKVTEIK